MLEVLICSLVTILPDYLFRRYAQGRRIGKEITLYSVWFELRWGITACAMLTIGLITVIFYNHPTSVSATYYFRTVPIVSEVAGRVAEINVRLSQDVKAGDTIFRLEDSKQRSALETASRRVAEIDAAMVVARADVAATAGQVEQADAALRQAQDELETKEALRRRNADVVAVREIERLQNNVKAREGALAAAIAARGAAEARVSTLLPAQKASAEAARDQAAVELDKTIVRAGVSGRVEQFALKVGDFVNPFARPAGLMIPEGGERPVLQAAFHQIEAQVMRPGMIAEAACVSKPFTVIPLVVVHVQEFIAAGQFRASEVLVDATQSARPGTVLVFLEPLYAGGLDDVPRGSSCVVNAYSSSHEVIAAKETGALRRLALHAVDAVGLVHAVLLRVQVVVMPVKLLVLSGH
jgi:multidrug resistance efflux pump